MMDESSMTTEDLGHKQKWDDVMKATQLHLHPDPRVLETHTKIMQHFTKSYDLLNSKTPVTDQQLDTYQAYLMEFGKIWVQKHGLISVTPYLHILFKHSYAYLKEFRSLREWSQEAFEASHKRHKQYYSKTNFGG